MSTELVRSEPGNIAPMPMAPSVEGMITLAIEKGASVDTIERLMAVRREVRAEQAKEAFDRALAAFQAECPTIQKTAKVMNKDGRSVRYQYAPLDAIIAQVKGLLQKHGFSYNVNAKAEPTQVTAICKLTHTYGHSESSEFAVPVDKGAFMNPAQTVASALTFAKRYAFCNAAGIMTGDADDDSQASHDGPGTTAQSRPQPTQKLAKKPTSQPPATKPAATTTAVLPKEATEEQKARWLATLKPLGEHALTYAYKVGWLLGPGVDMNGDAQPGEPLELIKLCDVPTTKKQADKILAEIQARMDGSATAPKEGESDHHQAEWYQFPMPWGKHAGTPLGELDKKYLYGLWANYEVETEYNGKPKKAETISKDEHFREMLDAAGEHYEFTKED